MLSTNVMSKDILYRGLFNYKGRVEGGGVGREVLSKVVLRCRDVLIKDVLSR